ncbi:MAG: hypothetical protein IKA65_00495 [Lentisphaeria bacterium]|nr:hypothetical protein [Lentisphaeria bacterium]
MLKEKIRALFEKYYVKGLIEEYLASRFDAILISNDRWEEVLEAAAKNYQPQIPGKVVL